MGAKTEQELIAVLEGGAEAAARAAQEGHVYELTLESTRHGALRVRPTPISVELDVASEGLVLLATAVHNARRDGLASRLDLPKDHLANVQRIVEARIGVGPCVFVSASAASSSAVVAATRRIAEKLVQLKLASARTLVILHGKTNHVAMLGILGTPMYEGSDVFVSTIGRVMKPDSSPEKSRKEALRTLFEGGAWAVERDAGTWPTEIQIAVEPPATLTVQTAREDAAAWVRAEARAAEARVSLLAVYDASHAKTMLRAENEWRYLWDGLAVESALKDVRAAPGPLIFALHDGEARLLRLALRALYDLGLMRDAAEAVLVLVADERSQQIQSTSLLYMLGDWHALRRRETGRGGRGGRGGLRRPTKTSKDK
jgi:hypothetical protein